MKNRVAALALLLAAVLSTGTALSQEAAPRFNVRAKTTAELRQAILDGRITTLGIVEAYLRRIRAYNGTSVNQPEASSAP